MDFVSRMHGLERDEVVEPFELGMAIVLLLVAAMAGYLLVGLSGWCELVTPCAPVGPVTPVLPVELA